MAPGGENIILTTDLGGGYTLFGGTSAAAPHVSGVVALILSLNPNLSPATVRSIIRTTADPSECNPGIESQCGQGVVNAYVALKYTLENYGGTIGGSGEVVTFHEDLTIMGSASFFVRGGTNVRLDQGVALTVNGTFSVGPSSTFELGQDAEIIIKKDNTTISGTSSQPVRFEPLSSGDRWKWLRVEASGVTFEHIIVSGAKRGLYINGSYGELANNTTIRYSSFTNNSVAGIYFYNAKWASVNNSKIENNGGHGVYLGWDTEINHFSHNLIIQNGGSGIYIHNPSVLRMDEWHAHNRVTGNEAAEIYLTSNSARLYASNYAFYGAGSDIIGSFDIYDDFIYNLATTTDFGGYVSWEIPAEYNYWGFGHLQPVSEEQMFEGPVDWKPRLKQSDTHFGSGSQQIAVAGSKPVATEVMSAGLTASVASGGGGDRAWLERKQHVLALKNWIASHPADPHKAGKLRDLYGVLVWDRADRLGARESVLALLEAARADYATLRAQRARRVWATAARALVLRFVWPERQQ